MCSIGYFIESIVYMVLSVLLLIHFSRLEFSAWKDRHVTSIDPNRASALLKVRRIGIFVSCVTLATAVDPQGVLDRYPWVVIPSLRDCFNLASFWILSHYIVVNYKLSRFKEFSDHEQARMEFRFCTVPVLALLVLWCGLTLPAYILNSSLLRGIYNLCSDVYLTLGLFVLIYAISSVYQSFKNSAGSSSATSGKEGISKEAKGVLIKLTIFALGLLLTLIYGWIVAIDYIIKPGLLSEKVVVRKSCDKYNFMHYLLVNMTLLGALFLYGRFTSRTKMAETDSKINKSKEVQTPNAVVVALSGVAQN